MKIVATNTDGDLPVTWYKKGRDIHWIEYGKQAGGFRSDIEAAHEFGECVRHSLQCAGKLDWTDND